MTSANLARVRFVGYVLYAVGAPVLIYTESKGWTGQDEYRLYLGLGAAFGITAAANVSVSAQRLRQRVMGVIKPKPEA